MATVTHTFPGTIVYNGVAPIVPVSILGINLVNQVGSTTLPVPPALTNGQIYVGTSNPAVVAAVTPTTTGGVSGINANTINLVSNGDTTTFNVKIDETSEPQLRGVRYDVPIDTAVTQPVPLKNQWTQVFNYNVPALPGVFTIYTLTTEPNAVYMVEFNYDRRIDGTDMGVNKQLVMVTDTATVVAGVSMSATSNGIGANLSIAANRELITPFSVGASIINFNILNLTSASTIVGTITVTRAA